MSEKEDAVRAALVKRLREADEDYTREWGSGDLYGAAADEIERLRPDAERYMWLRAQHWSDSPLAVVADPKRAVRLGYECPSLALLDAAIDAALAASLPSPPQAAAGQEPMTERDHWDYALWQKRLGELADAHYEAARTDPARRRARAALMLHATDCATGWRARSALAAAPAPQEGSDKAANAVETLIEEGWMWDGDHWRRLRMPVLPAAPAPQEGRAAPEGWKLAPVEPTTDMVLAAYQAQGEATSTACEAIYRAMLAAAPLPKVES